MMKKVVLLIALLCFCFNAACRRGIETTNNSNGANNAFARDATGSGNTSPAAVVNQSSEAGTQAEKRFPTPTGFVNDYAKVVDAATKARLEKILENLKQRSAIEFAVVTIETTGGEDIAAYSLAMAREWGVGPKTGTGGLLLLAAINDRKWHIQVSRSLEVDLPDDVVGELGRLLNEPFRAGQYGEGLTRCVKAIIARLSERRGFKLDEETLPSSRQRS